MLLLGRVNSLTIASCNQTPTLLQNRRMPWRLLRTDIALRRDCQSRFTLFFLLFIALVRAPLAYDDKYCSDQSKVELLTARWGTSHSSSWPRCVCTHYLWPVMIKPKTLYTTSRTTEAMSQEVAYNQFLMNVVCTCINQVFTLTKKRIEVQWKNSGRPTLTRPTVADSQFWNRGRKSRDGPEEEAVSLTGNF